MIKEKKKFIRKRETEKKEKIRNGGKGFALLVFSLTLICLTNDFHGSFKIKFKLNRIKEDEE